MRGLLHGEGLLTDDLALLPLHRRFEEVGVGGDGIKTGHLDVLRHLEAERLLETLHGELGRTVKRIARHTHLAYGGDGHRELPFFAREILAIFLIGVYGREHVGLEDVRGASPIHIVESFVVREARVGIKDVDAAERFFCLVEDGVHALFRGYVAHHGHDLLRVECRDLVGAKIDCEDLVVTLDKQLQHLEPYAAVCTGKHYLFA